MRSSECSAIDAEEIVATSSSAGLLERYHEIKRLA
jgi:hypothetical protein